MKNFLKMAMLILTISTISQTLAVQRVYEEYYDEPYDRERYHGVVGTPVVAAADATDDVLLGVGGLFGAPRRERRYYYN